MDMCKRFSAFSAGRMLLVVVFLSFKNLYRIFNYFKCGLENREYGRGDPLRWPRDTLYPQELALTPPTCGGRSVGIVRLRTKTTEFVFLFVRNGLPPDETTEEKWLSKSEGFTGELFRSKLNSRIWYHYSHIA
jgi:hypothetical protein